MSVKVRIPEVLAQADNGSDQVTLEASTVKEMIDALEKATRHQRTHLRRTGNVRRFINVFVNEETSASTTT